MYRYYNIITGEFIGHIDLLDPDKEKEATERALKVLEDWKKTNPNNNVVLIH